MSDLEIVQSSEFIVQSYGKSRNGDRCGMADERTTPPYNQPSAVPAKYNPAAVPGRWDCGMSFHEGRLWPQMDMLHWPTLLKKDGDDLFDHYRHMLESLGKDFSPSSLISDPLCA